MFECMAKSLGKQEIDSCVNLPSFLALKLKLTCAFYADGIKIMSTFKQIPKSGKKYICTHGDGGMNLFSHYFRIFW